MIRNSPWRSYSNEIYQQLIPLPLSFGLRTDHIYYRKFTKTDATKTQTEHQ